MTPRPLDGRRCVALAVAVALAGALVAMPVAAARPTRCLIVNPRLDARYRTLQAAVDAAAPGDELRVKGTCVGGTTVTRSIRITGIANRSFGPPTLDGGGTSRVLTITGGSVSITGLTITHGTATYGGGISASRGAGQVRISDSMITGNRASTGGGIWNNDADLTIHDSMITDNTAGYGGGAALGEGRIRLTGTTTVSGNTASGAAGGMAVGGHVGVELHDTSAIRDNTAGGDGGGMRIIDTSVTLFDQASIDHNSAGADGGGVWVAGVPGSLHLRDASSISHNTAVDGGGVWASHGWITLRSTSSISANVASGNGGGVHLEWSMVTIDYSGARRWQAKADWPIWGNSPDNCFPIGSVTGCVN